jgi:hypothetical protein
MLAPEIGGILLRVRQAVYPASLMICQRPGRIAFPSECVLSDECKMDPRAPWSIPEREDWNLEAIADECPSRAAQLESADVPMVLIYALSAALRETSARAAILCGWEYARAAPSNHRAVVQFPAFDDNGRLYQVKEPIARAHDLQRSGGA